MRSEADNTRNTRDFTEGGVTKALALFATPLFLSSLLQIAYNMADMIIVGQKLGKVGLSAVSIGGDVTNFLTFVAMGFSNAGQILISQYIGSGQKEKIVRFIGTMFDFLMICAASSGVICYLMRAQILGLMNTPPEAFDEAMNYAAVSMTGLMFIYGYNIVSAVLRGMGDSIRPFIFIGLASVCNVVMDIVFVIFMDMGSGGAALATVLSQGLSFILCSIYILRNSRKYELVFSARELLTIDGKMLTLLVRLGFPMAIKFAAVHFSKLLVNSYVNSYGIAVSAFSGIAHKISSISNMLSNSVNTAGATMVGQNIGAEKYERVTMVVKSVFAISLTICTIMAIAIVIFPEQLYGLFTHEADVIEIGIKYVPIAVLLFYSTAARSGMNALINGSGNYKVNFATAILDGIVLRIGLALMFGLGFGMEAYGFWLGDAIAGYTPFWIGIIFYYSGKWKKKSV